MSERPIESSPHFATCHCEHCGGGIEFNASDFAKDEIRAVECPHCHKQTEICIDPSTPKEFSDFIGQNKVKERLELAVAAARSRGESLDHILLIGKVGSGKTTLAKIIAKAMGANLKFTTGEAIETIHFAGPAGTLVNLEEGDVLFINEIQNVRGVAEEELCHAMEDFKLNAIIDQGENAHNVRLNLPRFTLIGSTTTKERLTQNLLSRFQIIESMEADRKSTRLNSSH